MQLRVREAVVLVKVRQMIANKTVLLRVRETGVKQRDTEIHIYTYIHTYRQNAYTHTDSISLGYLCVCPGMYIMNVLCDYLYICIKRLIFKDLAHRIMRAVKSEFCRPAGWRLKEKLLLTLVYEGNLEADSLLP